MNLFANLKPEINVQENEYNRLLGYPSEYKPEGKSAELAAWAREWYQENGRPWVYGIITHEIKSGKTSVAVNGQKFFSEKLARQFYRSGADRAIAAVISAGEECEEKALELWNKNKPDEYFFLEIYGSAVVEYLVSAVNHFLCTWAEENNSGVLPHYSPGYSRWKIEDQPKLWNLVKNRVHEFPGKIKLLESGMLKPKKSMLALFGIQKRGSEFKNMLNMIPCTSCSFNQCRYRRMPYRKKAGVPEKSSFQNNIMDAVNY